MCISNLNSCFQPVFLRVKDRRAVVRCCELRCCQTEWFLRIALGLRDSTKGFLCSPTGELEVAGEHPARGNRSPA